jgi:hypothetical protein
MTKRNLLILTFVLAGNAFGQDLNNPNGLVLCSGANHHNCWGSERYPDGTTSSGQWWDGKLNGLGTTKYAGGDTYVGEFKNHMKHGQGIYTRSTGERLEGIFENDKFIRKAKVDTFYLNNIDRPKSKSSNVGQEFASSRQKINPNNLPICPKDLSKTRNMCWGEVIYGGGMQYTGEFRNNTFEGEGIVITPKGFTYQGGFSNGAFHGYGVWEKNDKTYRYVGQFRDGKYDGIGTETNSDGSKYEGEFKANIPNGKGVYTKADGTRLEGVFVDGKLYDNSVQSGSLNLFMDQLIRGGGIQCSQERQRCKNSNDYNQCMYYFNLNNPGC